MSNLLFIMLMLCPSFVFSQNVSGNDIQKYSAEFNNYYYKEKFKKAAQAYEWLLLNSTNKNRNFYEVGILLYDYLAQEAKKDADRTHYKFLLDSLRSLPIMNDFSSIMDVVTEYPNFPDGNDAFADYINENVLYPNSFRNSGLSWAKVKIKFTVGVDGSITDVDIYSGFGEQWDNHIKDIIKASPKWIPGKINGSIAPVELKSTVQLHANFE